MASEFVAFFTDAQAATLAGISRWQLSHWRSTDVLPAAGGDDSDEPPLNAFRDVVAWRTLATLRKQLSLPRLRSLSKWLRSKYTEPFSSIRFFVAGQEVFFKEPTTGELLSTAPHGQRLITYELERIVHEIEPSARKMLARDKESIGKVSRTGVIVGTRISAETIQRYRAAGYTPQEIRKQYPKLRLEDVEAALVFVRSRKRKSA